MGLEKAGLRWGVEQRLEFIEFRLFWEGHVNRSDVMEQFGLSVNQASSDLNRYISFAPDNMTYDKSARGLPPLKWSSAMFSKTEETHGQQATKARRDSHEVAAG